MRVKLVSITKRSIIDSFCLIKCMHKRILYIYSILHEVRSQVEKRTDACYSLSSCLNQIISEPSYKNCAPTGDQLSDTDLQFLVRKTRFNKKIILSWFKNFRSECPNGKLSWSHLYGEQNDRMTMSKGIDFNFQNYSVKYSHRVMQQASVIIFFEYSILMETTSLTLKNTWWLWTLLNALTRDKSSSGHSGQASLAPWPCQLFRFLFYWQQIDCKTDFWAVLVPRNVRETFGCMQLLQTSKRIG